MPASWKAGMDWLKFVAVVRMATALARMALAFDSRSASLTPPSERFTTHRTFSVVIYRLLEEASAPQRGFERRGRVP
jgi:hypothetical protein